MSYIVISVILLVLHGLLRTARRKSLSAGEHEFVTGFGAASWVVAGLLVILTIWCSVWTIGANEVGVPKTFGQLGDPIQSGLHLTAPWTDVETLPTRPELATTVASIRTSDAGHAAVRISARWSTDRTNAVELYRQVRTGDEKKIRNDIVLPQIEGAANEYYGSVTNTEAINGSEWSKNATGISAKASARLQRYGITLVDVQIREVNPDQVTSTALAQVAAQQRMTQVAKLSKETAEAQAEQRRAEAQGIHDAAAKLADLSPVQVQLLCLQAAERVMNANQAKGIVTYTTPCAAGGSVGVLAK